MIDANNNEVTSDPVKFRVETPFGWTHAQSDLAPIAETDLIGLLPVVSPAMPSGGVGLERQPFSNLISPQIDWSQTELSIPALSSAGTRLNPLSTPLLEGLTLLPVKSVPEQEAYGAQPLLAAQGLTRLPALAAMPTQLPRPAATGGGLTSPSCGVLLIPMPETAAASGDKSSVQPGEPMLALPVEYASPATKSSPAAQRADIPEQIILAIPLDSTPTAPVKPASPVLHPQATAPAPVLHPQATTPAPVMHPQSTTPAPGRAYPSHDPGSGQAYPTPRAGDGRALPIAGDQPAASALHHQQAGDERCRDNCARASEHHGRYAVCVAG